jgi:GMP synthase-like glutamine amidotransferase
MILIVDMNFRKDSLGFYEFVSPIISITEHLNSYFVRHFSELAHDDFEKCDKIILSGTALKDQTTLKQLGKFKWIKECDKPILGICAGMQTIALVFGADLNECLEIGMSQVKTYKKNPLFSSTFKVYELHNFSVESPVTFDILAKSKKCVEAIKHKQKRIYGVLFHPEVRNPEILQSFILMKN